MGSLFKFIFYLIIIIAWALNNTKRVDKVINNLSSKPRPPSPPKKETDQIPLALRPQKEAIFDQNRQKKTLLDTSMLSYEQFAEMRREKAKSIKEKRINKKTEPKKPLAVDNKSKDLFVGVQVKKQKKTENPSFALKSSIKEGIIWSIILGPPRSKVPLNTKGFPLQR